MDADADVVVEEVTDRGAVKSPKIAEDVDTRTIETVRCARREIEIAIHVINAAIIHRNAERAKAVAGTKRRRRPTSVAYESREQLRADVRRNFRYDSWIWTANR